MDVTSPIIPVPGVGAFDEESCRYFLQEIGEQIVPFFPFMFGIGEVHTLLLERYGEDWVADALSVLHELMEAEDNANGLGDDGDIFRSWRHSWRHRNVGFCTLRSGQCIILNNRMIRPIPSDLPYVDSSSLSQPPKTDGEIELQAFRRGLQHHSKQVMSFQIIHETHLTQNARVTIHCYKLRFPLSARALSEGLSRSLNLLGNGRQKMLDTDRARMRFPGEAT